MIEFGIAAPFMLMLVLGIMELGMVMFVNMLMESSLRVAARWGVTGQPPANGDRLTEILAIIEDRTAGMLDMEEAEVTISSYPTFDDVGQGEDFEDGNGNGQWDPGETYKDCNGNGQWDDDRGNTGSAGNAREIVVYRIEYDWPLMTTMIADVLGDAGKVPLVANITVRNEPWNSGGSSNQACDL